MSFLDWVDKTIGTGFSEQTSGSRPLFGDVTWAELNKESANKANAANAATLTEAQGKATALSQGFKTESNLLGGSTQAGSPASGLSTNTGGNFLDILKWYSENAPSTFQETGASNTHVLSTVSTPQTDTKVVTTPQGSVITQKPDASAAQTSSNAGMGSLLPIIIIAGVIIIAIMLIKKR
jgi:hypothetical protein